MGNKYVKLKENLTLIKTLEKNTVILKFLNH